MKRWRKYVLAAGCVLCMSILAGCGNNDKETEQAKETTRMEETDETVGTDMNDTENDNLPDNGNDVILALEQQGIRGTFAGKVTDSHDKVIRNGDSCRYLNRPGRDEIWKLEKGDA